ncbi:MAG: 50S ribosomal protein L30e [Candidatus Diapherotrites archaeon]|nr:50S ribosomal protein L30e [Candidatus Diapherotrites archaeon]
MDINKEIRRAVDTGKVVFGSKSGLKKAASGDAKAIIYAANAPEAIRQKVEKYTNMSNILVFQSEKNGIELGEICGKPFVILVMSVMDEGRSKIISAIKETTTKK